MAWRARRVAYADVVGLREALGVGEVTAWTLVRRGLADPAAAREFLAADGPLAPPEGLAGVAAAADRLALAVRRGEPITVHGDYDCDGVSSTAILLTALRARGARAEAFLPSRFTDGYGVHEGTVERLAAAGTRVLVCVDCGTSAVEPLTRAVELGMEPIVIDHHLAGGRRPPAILVNPALGRPPEDLPSAAGVVYRVVAALAARLDAGLLAPAPEAALDLVALATVADAVPLVGENRRLVARGLAAMRAAPRPGIAALLACAGVDRRMVDARTLGFSLAPCINAAGRLQHPDTALELLMAPTLEAAEPVARALWELNAERRDIERAITEDAIARVLAEPPERRDRAAVVVSGDGWHEGVVGIVASRLVERFERPAIVIARDGERAKGSGRSLPGVDLHALVSGAAGVLTRFGGHAGAIGLELPAAAVGRFADELAVVSEGLRGQIARARTRTVDAVVSARDLTLGGAEELEALAPFGRGNPPVRLALPAARVEPPRRVGEGRHLELRVSCGGAHARAVGFGMGDRAGGIDPEERHDVVLELGIDRWQGVVGPRTVIQGIDPVRAPARPVAGLCAQACDVRCPERLPLGALRALVDDPLPPPGPQGPADRPAGVRDRRGEGAALPVLAALAGADGGAVAVVADVARRRAALATALEPRRLGLGAAALGGRRCAPVPMWARLGRGDGEPMLAMVDYDALAAGPLPAGMHLVLVDPPASPEAAEWARHRAAGRHLHLVWGPEDAVLAEEVAEREWELRPVVTEVYRALRAAAPPGDVLGWDARLEALLLGDGPVSRPPQVAARALAVLRELGLAETGDAGVRLPPDPPRRELGDSALYLECQARLAAARATLARAETIDLMAAEEVAAAP